MIRRFPVALAATLLIGLVLFGCKKSSTLTISRDAGVFEAEDAEAVLALAKEAKVNQPMALDLAKDSHYRFWKKQLYLAGASEETHPELFRVTDSIRQYRLQHPGKEELTATLSHEETTGIAQITSFVADHTTAEFSTSGLLSYPYGTVMTATLSIGLYNQAGQVIGQPEIASGYQPDQLTRLAVESQGNATGADSVYSLYAYFYQDNNGVHHNVIKAVTANVVDSIINNAPMPCTGTSPVPTCNNAPCTNQSTTTICMTRRDPGCSYCYSNLSNRIMMVPLQGHIVYSGNINVDSHGKPAPGSFGSVTLTRLPMGGGCPAIPLQGNFLDYVTVQGNKLSWNISPGQFPNTCLMSGDSVLFQLTVYVMIGTTPAFATITNAPKVDPPALRIPRIFIVSGCMAEGTKITLADGQYVPIEKVPMQAGVKTPDDKALFVDYSTTGTEEDPSIRITTDKNNNLLLTSTHPVMTPEGARQAKELKPGDKVLTEKGEAKILAVTTEQYDGTVWNLAVSPKGEEKYNGEATAFYANGILVGDHKMQNYARYKIWTHEEVLGNLPLNWHKDYLNSVNRRSN